MFLFLVAHIPKHASKVCVSQGTNITSSLTGSLDKGGHHPWASLIFDTTRFVILANCLKRINRVFLPVLLFISEFFHCPGALMSRSVKLNSAAAPKGT